MDEDVGWGLGEAGQVVLRVYFWGGKGVGGGSIHNCVCSPCVLGVEVFRRRKWWVGNGGRP